jgi:AraC-like DNA-binding protein
MAVDVEVFEGLRNLAVVEQEEGNPVRLAIGPDTINLGVGDCFLLPPDRPYGAAWNSVGATVTTVSIEDLQREAAGLVDQETVKIDFTGPITPAAGRHWARTIRYVLSFVTSNPLLATAPLARRELSWLVNSAVLACFPNSTLAAASPPYRNPGDAPQPLRRALAFVDEHAGNPITLNDIASAAQLSSRGLQVTFRRHLDTTPLSYLRSVRMERAHRDLLDADPSNGVSVAAVAARWGFTHLGRFATEYKRRYGIYPSRTLRS